MLRKLMIVLLILLCFSSSTTAKITIDKLLTTEGLNSEGKPVTVKDEFSLTEDKGVQYYIEWNSDGRAHDIALRWFGPDDKLLNFLYLSDFSKTIVRDYISFEQSTATQYFIPKQPGVYSIHLYLDQELISMTEFRIK